MYTFSTKLTRDECLNRITGLLNADDCRNKLNHSNKLAFFTGRDGLIGKVNHENYTFRLQKLNRFARNTFARKFHGQLIETEQGTIIKGQFKLYLFAKLFMTIWFGGLLVAMPLQTTLATLGDRGDISAILLEILQKQLMVMPMVLLGVILLIIFIMLDLKNEKYILDSVKRKLHVEDENANLG